MKIEKIIWDDAGAFGEDDDTWVLLDVIISNYRTANFIMVSVGYVIYEDDDSLIVAQSHDSQYGQYSQPLRIPKGMIQKRIVLVETQTNG